MVKIPAEITETIKLPIIIIYGSQIPRGKEKYLIAFNIFELAIIFHLHKSDVQNHQEALHSSP